MRPINFDLYCNCCQNNRIWKSIWLKHRCIYRIYKLVAKHGTLNLINLAMMVKGCKITREILSNSLMVAKYSYRHLRFIFRPLKIMHHSCKYTKYYKTSILIFVCCSVITWIVSESCAGPLFWRDFMPPLNPFPNKPWFLRVCSTRLLKTLREKEKLLVTSNFSFSHSVFYPFGEHSATFIKFENVVCKVFEFGRV